MTSDYADWRERLAEANDPAFWPITAIDEEVRAGRAQFWCDGHGALVTKITEYPGGARVLEAVAAAGDMEALTIGIEPITDAFARSRGCTHLFSRGRLGWARRMPGWKAHQLIMSKELTDG